MLETTAADGILEPLITHAVVAAGCRVVMLGGRERLDYPFNRAQEIELEFVHSMHHSGGRRGGARLRDEGRFRIGPLITHRLAPIEVPGFWKGGPRRGRDHLGVVIDWSRS